MTKFKTLYLHVGSEKTGTTSIQSALFHHRNRLRELDYFFPETFAVGANVLLAAMFHPDPLSKPLFKVAIDKRGGTQESFRAHMLAQLEAEVHGVEAHNLILSSEFLAAQSNVADLKSFCDDLAERTQVVLYLREPVSLALSLHSTFIKSGGSDFPALKRIERGQLPILLDARRSVERLLEHFDRADFQVRIFEEGQLANGNAVDDFLSMVGLEDQVASFKAPRQNPSLSREALELMKLVNAHLPPIVDGQRSEGRRLLLGSIGALDRTGQFGRTVLSEEHASRITALTEPGNEWIRAEFFPDQSTLFAPRPTAATATSDSQPLVYAAELLAGAYGRIAELESALRQAETQADVEPEARE